MTEALLAHPWSWLLTAAVAGWAVGAVFGHRGEARLWRNKANPEYRTAMCSAGKFYYVLPEHEYVVRTALGAALYDTEHFSEYPGA